MISKAAQWAREIPDLTPVRIREGPNVSNKKKSGSKSGKVVLKKRSHRARKAQWRLYVHVHVYIHICIYRCTCVHTRKVLSSFIILHVVCVFIAAAGAFFRSTSRIRNSHTFDVFLYI